MTVEQVLRATKAIAPAIEIIDSRILDWKFKFEDTVADNGSSAGAIIGTPTDLPSFEELADIPVIVKKNGEIIDQGVSSAVMGNPAKAIAWLANMLSEYDISLKAGQFILAGAITAAAFFEANDQFEIDFGTYGQLKVTFAD